MVSRKDRPIVPVEHYNEREHRRLLATRANAAMPKDGTEAMTAPFRLMPYAAADLPDASLWDGGVAYVSDEDVPAFSNGSSWLRWPDAGAITPERFGAVGNGVADDTGPCQDAIDLALSHTLAGTYGLNGPVHVYFPGYYKIASPLTIAPSSNTAFLSLRGRGRGAPTFNTTADIAIIQYDLQNGALYYSSLTDMCFVGSGNMAHTNEAAIKVINNTLASARAFNYTLFNNLTLLNFYHGIWCTQENGMRDWNNWTNILSLACYRGYYVAGDGTGNIYTDSNIVTNGVAGAVGIHLGYGNPANFGVGDLNISAIQFGGAGTGIKIDGGTYGGNIGAAQVQFDAGIAPGWDLTRCEMLARGVNYGGATTITVDTSTTTSVRLDESRESYGSIGTTTLNNFDIGIGYGVFRRNVTGGDLTITGLARGYDSREIVIQNHGTANNIILKHENAGSSAANRFSLPGAVDVTIGPRDSATLIWYGPLSGAGVESRWLKVN